MLAPPLPPGIPSQTPFKMFSMLNLCAIAGASMLSVPLNVCQSPNSGMPDQILCRHRQSLEQYCSPHAALGTLVSGQPVGPGRPVLHYVGH